MKKVGAREFQRGFGKKTAALKPGQSLTVTMRGKPLGVFTKLPNGTTQTPNFLANLQTIRCSFELGDQILREFNSGFSAS